MTTPAELGATYQGNGQCSFCVWAPLTQRVELRILSPQERTVLLEHDGRGYHSAEVEGVEPGTLYLYRLDGEREHPDPASRHQPQGVHGPSAVLDQSFDWQDPCWFGLPLSDYLIYELHVGTFTPEGTFDAVIGYLDYLKGLGVTAVELMPVAQFPGSRNWGYDGVYPFAVQESYGGPQGLKRLVDACHQRGLAAVLDVVYNHMGPEGNYLRKFGPYFTEKYRTPWGDALNFDGPYSDDVKRFFIENSRYWFRDFHFDALRLDAVHAILDYSTHPLMELLALNAQEVSRQVNRRVHLIAESDANDARLITARELGGDGLDAQWSDDFHHCVQAILTGERDGYYQDYGRVGQLASAYREGYAYTGQYSSFRKRTHGSRSHDIPAQRFVVCGQNHDQVGNRMLGERLSHLVSFEKLKLAAGAVLLSPFIPLLFMGEEYAEDAPFQYFISHTDPELVEAVRRGRKEEFSSFQVRGEPPDAQDEATFMRCKLDHSLREQGKHQVLLDYYRELIRLRRETPALAHLSKEHLEATAYEKSCVLSLRRWSTDDQVAMVFNFGDAPAQSRLPLPSGAWRKLLDSADPRWDGPGSKVPESLTSDEEVVLDTPPHTLVVLAQV